MRKLLIDQRLEGGGVSQLAQMIKRLGYNEEVAILLGTVVDPLPNIRIALDNFPGIVLEKDDIIVLEHLTRHKRIVTMTHNEGTPRDMGDTIPFPEDHSSEGGLAFKYEYVELQFEDVLKPDDRVALIEYNGGQGFLVFDRIATYRGE